MKSYPDGLKSQSVFYRGCVHVTFTVSLWGCEKSRGQVPFFCWLIERSRRDSNNEVTVGGATNGRRSDKATK